MTDIIEKYTRKTESVQRLTLVGPMDESKSVIDALVKDEFKFTYSGPYSDWNMWPKVDTTRFQIIAERVMP